MYNGLCFDDFWPKFRVIKTTTNVDVKLVDSQTFNTVRLQNSQHKYVFLKIFNRIIVYMFFK